MLDHLVQMLVRLDQTPGHGRSANSVKQDHWDLGHELRAAISCRTSESWEISCVLTLTKLGNVQHAM